MNRIAHIWLIIGIALFPLFVNAHNENEILYEFNTQSLSVHLTPRTLIDLLKKTGEVPEDQAVVKLEGHKAFFGDYFDAQIEWKMGETDLGLKLESMDIGGHDAMIHFRPEPGPSPDGEVSITVNAFTEVYNHCSNEVKWTGEGQAYSCRLDGTNRTCRFTLESVDAETLPIWLYVVVGVGFALLTYLVRAVIKRSAGARRA